MTQIVTSRDSAKRIAQTVRRMERMPYAQQGRGHGHDEAAALHHVQITSTTQTASRYPGTLYRHDADAGTYEAVGTAGEIWVATPNGETLSTGQYYHARPTGMRASDLRPIFQMVGPTASSFSGAAFHTHLSVSGTLISWSAVTFDEGGYAGGTLNTFTIPVAGKYLCSLWCYYDTAFAASVSVSIVKNSAAIAADTRQVTVSAYQASCSLSVVASASAGDAITATLFSSSSNYIINSAGSFSVVRLN